MTKSETPWKNSIVQRLIELAIEEDMPAGDVTTLLCLPQDSRSGVGRIVARENCIVCGVGAIEAVFLQMQGEIDISILANDGTAVEKGDVVAELKGSAATILSAERTILNFLQRLSGISTYTRNTVRQAKSLTVLDTRKTTPGWRMLEKYAVRTGGGQNHRMNLSEMIMVKDNHIDLSGVELPELLNRILTEKAEYIPVEVEIRSQAELESIAGIAVEVILLDNMQNEEIEKALSFIRKNWDAPPMVEISGNITSERFASLEQIGVERVSMGALTYSAPAVDLALELSVS